MNNNKTKVNSEFEDILTIIISIENKSVVKVGRDTNVSDALISLECHDQMTTGDAPRKFS